MLLYDTGNSKYDAVDSGSELCLHTFFCSLKGLPTGNACLPIRPNIGALGIPRGHWHTAGKPQMAFPRRVSLALTQTSDPLLTGLVPLVAVPEFKVPLPGGTRSSQNDLFSILGRSLAGPV